MKLEGMALFVLWTSLIAAGVHAAGTDQVPCDPQDEGKGSDLCAYALSAAARIEAEQNAPVGLREADAETDVTEYLLDIELVPEYSGSTVTAVRVQGSSTIEAEPTGNGLTTFTVDLRSNMTVNSVTGNVSGWSRVGDTVVITLNRAYDAGEPFQVTVAYQGYPQTGGFGAFKWWIRNGNLVVASLSEPYFARYWWPCKDSLNDKATMRMHATVPGSMTAVSNGVLEGTDALSGGRVRYRWHESYPMVAYLASLAATNYQRYDLQYSFDDGSGPRNMPVPCYLYPDHWDSGAGQPVAAWKTGCDEIPTMLTTLGGRYGLYPFLDEKYGIAEYGGTGGYTANMEHQTCTSMAKVDNNSDIVLHELAHQWWGDDVTCETWYDIWLNEGFATYSETVYREFKPGGGMDSYWSRLNARRPSLPNNQVYRTSISPYGNIFSTNDVYQKGAWVMHMLRHVMGTDPFFSALSDYRDTYRNDSATTAEFAASISASFGHDLTWFTDQWVMNPGSPDYEWNWASDTVAGRNYVKLAVWQKQNGEGYGLFTMPIDIRVTTAGGATVQTVWNDGWVEYYVLPVSGAPTAVEFDEDGGVNDRNWILTHTRTNVTTAVQGPPVLLTADITPFAGTDARTTVDLAFSENIGSLDVADVALVGQTSGPHTPWQVSYNAIARTATVTYVALPDDVYTFTVLSAGVTASGKALDGEVDDTNWWDPTLLPSGDGQPGGDAVLLFTKRTGDADGDGDVNLADYAAFPPCLTGPAATPYGAGCGVFDFDVDADVDLADYASFQEALATP